MAAAAKSSTATAIMVSTSARLMAFMTMKPRPCLEANISPDQDNQEGDREADAEAGDDLGQVRGHDHGADRLPRREVHRARGLR